MPEDNPFEIASIFQPPQSTIGQPESRFSITKWVLPLLMMIAGVAGFYHLKHRPKSEPIKIEEQTWRVSVTAVKPTTLAPTLTLYGRVESPKAATLRTPPQSFSANGEVMEVTVLEGELVKKG
jgi:multidrug efflux pump subunit AcrA (membrane-fusion protein)